MKPWSAEILSPYQPLETSCTERPWWNEAMAQAMTHMAMMLKVSSPPTQL